MCHCVVLKRMAIFIIRIVGSQFERIRVIPGEINKEFRLTFRISTKFGMLIAYIEVITHTKF